MKSFLWVFCLVIIIWFLGLCCARMSYVYDSNQDVLSITTQGFWPLEVEGVYVNGIKMGIEGRTVGSGGEKIQLTIYTPDGQEYYGPIELKMGMVLGPQLWDLNIF